MCIIIMVKRSVVTVVTGDGGDGIVHDTVLKWSTVIVYMYVYVCV